jgi:parvulin-like peptidyl-prolyl isomerase
MICTAHKNIRPPVWPLLLRCTVLTLAASLVLSGCRQKSSSTRPDANDINTPQTPTETNTVIATINNQVITHQDVRSLVAEKMAPLQQNPSGVAQAQYAEYLRQREKEFTQEVTDILIVEALLTEEVKRQGITVTDEEIERRLQNAPPDANQDPVTYRKRIERDIAFRKLFAACYEGKIAVTEADARAYFQARPTKFNTPAQVRARHIQMEASQQALAENLLAQLKDGADFAALAKSHSQDESSAAQGGDVGLFQHKDMEKPFADAAFALQVGEISGIVKTSYGLHLIMVTERQDAVKRDFDDARDEIVAILTEQQKRSLRQAFIKSLRDKADIRYN